MLGLTLLMQSDGPRLKLALASLKSALHPDDHLCIVDARPSPHPVPFLAQFVEDHEAQAEVVQLDQPGLDVVSATQAMRPRLRGTYVMGLTEQDLVQPKALAELRRRVQADAPDMMIANDAYWVAGPASQLACADSQAMQDLAGHGTGQSAITRSQAQALLADPRRLVLSREAPELPPVPDWARYDAALDKAGSLSVFTTPVLLRPLPQPDVARLIEGLAPLLSDKGQGSADVALILRRVDHALVHHSPEDAARICAACRRVLGGLPRKTRRTLGTLPGQAAQLLHLVHTNGEGAAFGLLSLIAAQLDRKLHLAQIAELRQLRQDLDVALPGPDYLMELYERVRNT